jgi:STE24 endopeptidase
LEPALKNLLLILFLATTGFTYWLRNLNLNYLKKHGNRIPEGFEGAIDQEKLRTSSAYTFDSSRLALWESLLDNLLMILFVFCGYITAYDLFITGLADSKTVQAVLFFMIMTWVMSLVAVPFNLYETFKIEARYNFNTTTKRLWLTDFIKSHAISSLLMAILLSTVFWLIQWSPDNWWFWVWGVLAVFSLFLMFISPYVIEPLFNKFEPVSDSELESRIRSMMEKAGLKTGQVLQMDSSRRSRHSNAYFTGIGKVKRIVLYDTLINQMTHGEIVAVLAHEIGHWKKGHVWKRLLVAELVAFAASWLAFHILQWPGLTGLLDLPPDLSLPAKVFIAGFIASLVMFPLTPLSAWRSRCHEREADQFASELTGRPEDLADALVKLSAENLSNLFPHPFYAAYYYSHPPAVERVATLHQWAGKNSPSGRTATIL